MNFIRNPTSFSNYTNPELNPHFGILNKAKFYIIKSSNFENVQISQNLNKWATSKLNQKKILDNFKSNFIILIFSVNKSRCIQGYALVLSNITEIETDIWILDKKFELGGSFDVKWLCKCDYPLQLLKILKIL
jgi:hypothetical protein